MSLSQLILAILAGLTGPAERIVSNHIKPERVNTLDEFFMQVRTLTLGTAVASKAMTLFQKKVQRPGEDVMSFASDLYTIFNLAFPTEEQKAQSQGTLKSRFLAGLQDFQLVTRLVEDRDVNTMTYMLTLVFSEGSTASTSP